MIFDRNRRLSLKRHEIDLWLLWNENRNSQVAVRSVSVPMTSSDLETRDARVQVQDQDRVFGLRPVLSLLYQAFSKR